MEKLAANSKPQLKSPSKSEFNKVLEDMYNTAAKNPDKNYLVILFFASHGFNYEGKQAVAAPYYDALRN
jgi:hypothetical protein